MILLEDQFALDQMLDCIIPFTCTEYFGNLKIEVYQPVVSIAEKYIELYKNAPFSDKAISFLDEMLLPELNKWGYERIHDDLFNWGYAYYADDASLINSDVIRSDTRLISCEDGLINLTSVNISELFNENCINLLNYATVSDNGQLLSVASENPHYLPDDETEIGVDTAELYRGNGYAVSNVAALARHLTSEGKRVWYKCSRYNIASRKTAEKAGFRCAGKYYYYAAYKKED